MLLFQHIFVTDGIRERTMKLNKIYTAILLSTLPLSVVQAAGLDRSGQSISAFLQPGNYADAGITVLDAEVQYKKLNVDDMAKSYYFPSAAVKVQATDNISLGFIYDQPYGAEAEYDTTSLIFGSDGEGTSVNVKTENLTALIGYQPNENWNFYAGPIWQTVEADIKLRGAAYGNTGYNVEVEKEQAWGWIAGLAYQIPEIALKAAITYRSEIQHDARANQSSNISIPAGLLPHLPAGVPTSRTDSVDATTPQSVNLDFQTGIAKDTLAFANVRWVHWSQFAVKPSLLGDLSEIQDPGNRQNLIDYSDDQWSANLGVGHKFTSKWSGSVTLGYDSGAGNPVTTLGPVEGYWSVGLGGQYSPAENYFIQAGVKYFWLGDAQAQTGSTIVGDFEDNHAMGYGLKIGYRF